MQDILKQVGLRIRQLRERKGISQEALAAASGLHRTYVGLIERGERNLSLTTVEAIAKALDVPPSELLQQSEAAEVLPVSTKKAPTKAKLLLNRRGATPEIQEVMAHILAIRSILINSKLTSVEAYDALYQANSSAQFQV